MTADQRNSLIRSLLTAFGGLAGGWFLAKGWLSQDQLSFLSANGPALLAMAVPVAAGIWAAITHQPKRMVATVAAMPEVHKVEMTPTTEGNALAVAANQVALGTPVPNTLITVAPTHSPSFQSSLPTQNPLGATP